MPKRLGKSKEDGSKMEGNIFFELCIDLEDDDDEEYL